MPQSIIILGSILLFAFGVPIVKWFFNEANEEIDKFD